MVAELVHPRMAVNNIQNTPSSCNSPLQQLTCHTETAISYEPGPWPVSLTSMPPHWSMNLCNSKFHTPLENNPAATRYKKQVDVIKNTFNDMVFPYLYNATPINEPITTANTAEFTNAIAVVFSLIPIPPINAIASNPSLKVVTNGKINILYFSDQSSTLFAHVVPARSKDFLLCGLFKYPEDCKIFPSLDFHLACILFTRRILTPMTEMIMLAKMENVPSQ